MMRRAKILFLEGATGTFLENRSLHSLQIIKGYQADEALTLAKQEDPDLILANIDITQEVWLLACESIRADETTRHIPIVVLASGHNENDRIRAFERGIDDLISTPILEEELLARIGAKLRRVLDSREDDRVLKCGQLVLNLEKLEAFAGEKRIPLSLLEFNLLKYFVENQGHVLSRRRILDAVWKDSVVSDRTVDTHIACIRRKLDLLDYTFQTVYGAGYAFKPKADQIDPAI